MGGSFTLHFPVYAIILLSFLPWQVTYFSYLPTHIGICSNGICFPQLVGEFYSSSSLNFTVKTYPQSWVDWLYRWSTGHPKKLPPIIQDLQPIISFCFKIWKWLPLIIYYKITLQRFLSQLLITQVPTLTCSIFQGNHLTKLSRPQSGTTRNSKYTWFDWTIALVERHLCKWLFLKSGTYLFTIL